MHCESCETQIHHTFDGIPYCPNPDCRLVKGAHDWEVIPIIFQMDRNRRICQAIGLAPPTHPDEDAYRTLPLFCWKCRSVLTDIRKPRIYCSNLTCDVTDATNMPEASRSDRVRDSGRVLARALRRNRY